MQVVDTVAHGPAVLGTLSEARFRIAGFGSAFPSAVVTNDDLADRLGVEPGWLVDQFAGSTVSSGSGSATPESRGAGRGVRGCRTAGASLSPGASGIAP